MRVFAVAAALLLVASPAAGGFTIRQEAMVTVAAKASPVTLAKGTEGLTTLGLSLTSATTRLDVLLASAQTVLKLSGNSSWEVRAVLVAHSNFGLSDDLKVQFRTGALVTEQVTIAQGVAVRSNGTWTSLQSWSSTSVEVQGAKATWSDSTLDLHIQARPDGSLLPQVVQAYRLTLT